MESLMEAGCLVISKSKIWKERNVISPFWVYANQVYYYDYFNKQGIYVNEKCLLSKGRDQLFATPNPFFWINFFV